MTEIEDTDATGPCCQACLEQYIMLIPSVEKIMGEMLFIHNGQGMTNEAIRHMSHMPWSFLAPDDDPEAFQDAAAMDKILRSLATFMEAIEEAEMMFGKVLDVG